MVEPSVVGVAKKLGAIVGHKVEAASISAAAILAEKYVTWKTGSKSDGDAAALNLAKTIMMKPNGRAAEYLDHFLKGSGETKTFEAAHLLAAEPGIRSRVYSEILRKDLGIKVGSERRPTSVDPVITIFQKNYIDQDWWFALGTFGFDWDVIGRAKDRFFVKIAGKNEYKWHPEEDRITKELHQAGDRLVKDGKAKNFWIVANPAVLSIPNYEANSSLIRMTTLHAFNPDYMPGLASQIIRSQKANM